MGNRKYVVFVIVALMILYGAFDGNRFDNTEQAEINNYQKAEFYVESGSKEDSIKRANEMALLRLNQTLAVPNDTTLYCSNTANACIDDNGHIYHEEDKEYHFTDDGDNSLEILNHARENHVSVIQTSTKDDSDKDIGDYVSLKALRKMMKSGTEFFKNALDTGKWK